MSDYREALSVLYTTLVDSRHGYAEAIKDAGKTGLVTLFEGMVALRQQAAVELEALLLRAGATPDRDGSYMSSVHRTIISFQSLLTDLDETVLPGFIDGEKRILKSYDDAIAKAPETDRDVLVRQRTELSDRIEEMERRHAKAA